MTFSIIGHCRVSGQFGIAIASSSPAVGARCAHVRAGVGVVATQNVTDPRLGPLALDMMEGGASPAAVMGAMAGRADIEHRQLMALDGAGHAVRSGVHVLGVCGEAGGEGCAAAGNMLAHAGVPAAMVAGFAEARLAGGELGAHLLAGLAAGLRAGGEAGPVHSAGLFVAGTEAWALTDLRVDWEEGDPVGRLEGIWRVWAPQMHDYVRRALEPGAAPGFGVAV